MFCFSSICYVCLKNNANLEDMNNVDLDNISFVAKLHFCAPETTSGENNLQLFICPECCCKLKIAYNFKKVCIKSSSLVKGYITQLKHSVRDHTGKVTVSFTTLASLNKPTEHEPQVPALVPLDTDKIKHQTEPSNDDSDVTNVKMKQETPDVGINFCEVKIEPDIEFYNEDDASLNTDEDATITEDVLKSPDPIDVQESNSSADESPKYPSNICVASFALESRLNYSEHGVSRAVVCPICNKAFTFKSKLKEHMPVHTGERSHRCDVCGKRFALKSNLKAHMSVHTGQRRQKVHQCNQCDKSYAFKSHLNNHLLTHTPVKPHVCRICNRAFNYKSNLNKHLNVHSYYGEN